MKERIEFVDAIKGFAIILMVAGHVIAWQMPDIWSVPMRELTSEQINASFLWRLIYSFHMPLFFMVSGYFAYKAEGGAKYAVWNKTKRLLVPYIFTGFFILAVRGYYGFWFLLSLFELSLFAIFFNELLPRINKSNKIYIDVIIVISLYILVRPLVFQSQVGDFTKFTNYMLPFFYGYLMNKYEVIRNLCFNKFTVLIVSFVILFANTFWMPNSSILCIIHRALSVLGSHIIGIIGSLIFWEFFNCLENQKAKKILSVIGINSLEVYLLHMLFIPQIQEVGMFWMKTGFTTCLSLQLINSIMVSVFAIVCSIILASFLKKSKLISQLFFGVYK